MGEFVAICDSLQFTPPSIVAIFFKRIALKNMYIYGTDYKRMLSRTNAVVKLYPNQRQIIFAEICRFVHFKTDDQDHFLCLGHALIPCKEYNGSCHITQVEKKDILVAFPIGLIQRNIVFIQLKTDELSNLFVCEMPNRIQADYSANDMKIFVFPFERTWRIGLGGLALTISQYLFPFSSYSDLNK